MHRSLPTECQPRRSRWPLAAASAVAAAALAGTVYFGVPQYSVQAQQRTDPGVVTPFGRAPLSFADIVERVKPAVVSIQVSSGGPKVARNEPKGGRGEPSDKFNRGGKGGGKDMLPDLPDDHPLNEFFKNLPKEFRGAAARPQAQGSGFVISPDGYVVTNNHVIDDASKIQVSFDQDNKYDAELVGTDQRTDLALLKIKASGKTFPFVKFAEKHAARRRLGHRGRQSVRPRRHRDGRHRLGAGPRHRLGPLRLHADRRGREPAATPAARPSTSTARWSASTPPSTARRAATSASPSRFPPRRRPSHRPAQDIAAPSSRGWLGVKIQNVDEDTAASLGLSEPKGALVNDVTTPGPAAEAGLKNGDAILSVNGTKIADSRDLARQIADFSPSTKVDVKILRGQKEQTITVKLGTFPTSQELAKAEPAGPAQPQGHRVDQLGLTVAPGTADKDGVVITDVDAGSDAAQKGIRVGRRDPRGRRRRGEEPGGRRQGVKEATSWRKAVLMRIKSGERDALRRRPAEEELTLFQV